LNNFTITNFKINLPCESVVNVVFVPSGVLFILKIAILLAYSLDGHSTKVVIRFGILFSQ
jgi:hypothetical protein